MVFDFHETLGKEGRESAEIGDQFIIGIETDMQLPVVTKEGDAQPRSIEEGNEGLHFDQSGTHGIEGKLGTGNIRDNHVDRPRRRSRPKGDE